MPRDTAAEIHETTKVMRSFLPAFQSVISELRELRISVDKLTKKLDETPKEE